MARTAAALSAVLILSACTSGNRSALPDADFFVSTGQTFVAQVGDTAGVVTQFSIVLVRFNGISEDSRCPEDVTCVQAGSVKVELTVQATLSLQDITIEVPRDGGAETEVAEEVKIEVFEVAPPAREGVEIGFVDYRILMRVTGTGNPFPTQ